jgi:hypothetical protein
MNYGYESQALNEERGRARVHGRLPLIADYYRVDEAITSKLARKSS